MNSNDSIDQLAAELRTLLSKRVSDSIDGGDFPRLHAKVLGWRSANSLTQLPGMRVMDIQPMLTAAISRVGDTAVRERLEFLLADTDMRYLSVKERGTFAARQAGVGYDAYRRAGGRLLSDLVVLAGSIDEGIVVEPLAVESPAVDPVVVEQVVVEPAPAETADGGLFEAERPEAAPSSHNEPSLDAVHRANRGLLVIGTVAVLAAVAVFVLANRGSDEQAQVETVDSSSPEEGTTSRTSEESDSETVDASDTELTADTAPTAGETVSDEHCRKPGFVEGDATAELLEAIDAVVAIADELPDGVCADEPLNKRGLAYWQELSVDRRLAGGLLAFEDESGSFVAKYLPMGLWQSYFRIGGSDGTRSVVMGGYPTGKSVALGDRYEMEISGDVVLIGEEANGTFYWMPLVAYEAWQEAEASDAPLGWPSSSVYTAEGSYRVDFTTGYLVQRFDGSLESVSVDAETAKADLPPAEHIKSRIISSIDGTSWFVDSDLKRWWISDSQTWECAGGGNNRVAEGLAGYTIHTLEYGGAFRCPAGDAASWPREGGVDIGLFCYDLHGPGFSAEFRDEGWACSDGISFKLIYQIEACIWQYGPRAAVKPEESDPRHFACEQAA